MNANFQRAINASLVNAQAREQENYLMAQQQSRNISENNLYQDSAIEMRENMIGKPDARRRLMAGVALDTLIMNGQKEYEDLRDLLLESRYSELPADDDETLMQAEAVMVASDGDPLVDRLREVHESMLAEEKEEEERRAKAIKNAINAAAREEEERRRREAEAAEAAKPVIPNRNALRAQRQAYYSKKQEGGKRTRKAGKKGRKAGKSRRSRLTRRRN